MNVTDPTVHANGDHAQYLDHTFRCWFVDGAAHVADDESGRGRLVPLDRPAADGPGSLVERIWAAVEHSGLVRLAVAEA